MIHKVFRLGAISALLVVVACGGSEADETTSNTPTPAAVTPPPGAITYHEHVAPILSRSCVGCHSAGSIAPFELGTIEEVRSVAPLIKEAVNNRSMPPWGIDSSGACNTFHGEDERWLSDEDLALINEWVDGDQWEGDPALAPEVEVAEPTALSKVSGVLDMGLDYEPNTNVEDDYRCFIVDADLAEDMYLTGYEVVPGNDDIVHHVLAYDISDAGSLETIAALDEADPGPGYTCYGSPGVWFFNLLASWAPGTGVTRFPEGTGLKVSSAGKVVIQVHYNKVPGGATDRTRINLELEDRVDENAQMLILGDFDLALPPGDPDARAFVDVSTSDFGSPVDVTVYGVFPHMHTLGYAMQMDHIGQERSSCVVRVVDWDFNWQQTFFMREPVILTPDDLFRLTCQYDTRERDRIVTFGEGTSDEMCLAVFYVTFGAEAEAVRPDSVGEEVPRDGGAEFLGKAMEPTMTGLAGGRGGDSAGGVALDKAGNLYVGMDSESSRIDVGSGSITLPGEGDGLLVKYNEEGDVLWSTIFGSLADDGIYEVEVLPGGDPVVFGWMDADMPLGDITLSHRGGRDAFVARVNQENGAVLWAEVLGGEGSEYPRAMDIGADGRVALGGRFYGSGTFGEATLMAANEGTSGFVVVFNDDGTFEGAWACASTTFCEVRAVALPEAGGEVIAGVSYWDTLDLGGDEPVLSMGGYEAAIVRLNASTGDIAWAQTFGDVYHERIYGLDVAGDGSIFATGYYSGLMSIGGEERYFTGSVDAFVLKMSASGEVQWLRTLGGYAGDFGGMAKALPEGGVMVGISYEGGIDIAADRLMNRGSGDLGLLRYDDDGEVVQAQRFGGPGGEWWPKLAIGEGEFAFSFDTRTPELVPGIRGGEGGDDIVFMRLDL